MKPIKTILFGKTTVVAMLLCITCVPKIEAQWAAGTPTTSLQYSSSYNGIQGRLSSNSYALAILTNSGTLTIGPENTTYCQFITTVPLYYFDHPISLANGTLTSYETANLILQTGIASSSGSNTRMTILQSNGNVGIGNTSPSEKLDVSGADAAGTIAVFESSPANIRLAATMYSAAYNWNTQTGDNGIFWTDGVGGAGQNLSSGFILAPWQGSHLGIRIDGGSGNLAVNSNFTSVILGTCGESSAINYGTSFIGFNASRGSTGTWTAYGDGSSSNGGATIFGDISGNLFFATMPKTNGSNQTASDATVLNQAIMEITSSGKVVIGKPFASSPVTTLNVTTPGTYNLYVAGGILTEQVRVAVVNSSTWADYVFADGYKLKPLNEVEQYLKDNKHLPDVPSASEVQNSGIDVAGMDATLLKKIEELTLYIIELQKQNSNNTAQIKQLNDQVKVLTGKK